MVCEGGWCHPKANYTTDSQWARNFIDKERGIHTETTQSAYSHLEMDHLWSGHVILIVSSTVNLQFHGWFVSISFKVSSQNVAAHVMAAVWPSSSYISSAWWGFQCLHGSTQGVALNTVYSLWEGTECPWLCLMTALLLFGLLCFPFFLHFLTSLIKLILWLKFFHRRKAGRGHGGQGP